MTDPRTTARATDATDDLITGRHTDAAGREHDVVTEATIGTTADEDVVADPADGGTGVVTDRHGS